MQELSDEEKRMHFITVKASDTPMFYTNVRGVQFEAEHAWGFNYNVKIKIPVIKIPDINTSEALEFMKKTGFEDTSSYMDPLGNIRFNGFYRTFNAPEEFADPEYVISYEKNPQKLPKSFIRLMEYFGKKVEEI